MRVAVTGASGQIGSEVVKQLRAAGHETLSLDIRPPTDPELPHRIIDLRAGSAVRAAFEGMDAVCHIGEIPNVWDRVPADVLSHNVEVGSSVIQNAAAMNVSRVIYTSSCQVYGCWGSESGPIVAPEKLPMDESAPRRPQNAYALSKLCNELFAEQTVHRSKTAIAAFRFPMVVGPWIVEKHLRKPPAHWALRADGLGTYVGLEDAAAAYLCALERGWDGFEAFHFVADDAFGDEPVREALRRLFPAIPLPEDWPKHASPVVTDKAKSLLDWMPKFSLRKKLEEARGSVLQSR